MTSVQVDVLLATYNGARYLEHQLDSILAQTHTHLRVLVSDDGSTDGTLALLERYRAEAGGRVVLVPHAGAGGGLVRNFENLMAASLRDGQADYVAFCDQDDVWLPEKIERSLAEMHTIEARVGASQPCLVHSDLVVVAENLSVMAPSFVRYQHMQPLQASPLSLLSMNQVTGCTMLVNKALLQLALPVPPEVIVHDWWCALLSGSGHRVFIDTPLIWYRQHGSNQVGAKNRGLRTRLARLVFSGSAVWRRVRQLGQGTYAQAQALQRRLRERGVNDGYVADYLAWRQKSLWHRLRSYRQYYAAGPELDRMSRCLLWSPQRPVGEVKNREE